MQGRLNPCTGGRNHLSRLGGGESLSLYAEEDARLQHIPVYAPQKRVMVDGR